ncbi:MAG TPA: hypothetical protein VLT51_07455 [Anaerolineales bacterium]|nr:hypothetical protein [Anaerolineales bacterium]
MSIEVISAVIGFVLTLMIFSYLIGDNPLFRIAIYIFIGVASGYAAVVIVKDVLFTKFQSLPLDNPPQLLIGLIPFFLAATLLAKLSPRISWIGNFAMAVLVGVGAATAVGGALVGTLIPQAEAATEALGSRSVLVLIEGAVMLSGTVLTLAYFQFGAKSTIDGSVKRNAIFELLAWLGRIFIAVTFGVLFAGVYMAALTAMIERLSSIINLVKSFLSP